jgi:hypothetical protein
VLWCGGPLARALYQDEQLSALSKGGTTTQTVDTEEQELLDELRATLRKRLAQCGEGFLPCVEPTCPI